MSVIIGLMNWVQYLLDKIVEAVSFICSLLLRLYLAPIFWMASNKKWNPFAENGTLNPIEGLKDTSAWFDESLGLPLPDLMAFLAWGAEYFGAVLLALGLATRWISIPLMFTMIVAAVTVHLQNGWLAVAEGGGSLFATERTMGAIERLDRAKEILNEQGNYSWLTENGSLVISNNGIEFAATYFIMLFALLVIGGGKYISLDYWIARKIRKQ